MPVSWQTRFFSSSATSTFRRIVCRTRWPGTVVSRPGGVRERVAQVLRDVLQRPDVEVGRGLLDDVREVGLDGAHAPAFSCGGPPGATAEDAALEQAVAHHAVPPVRAAGDLAAGVQPLERRLGVRVDHEAAVLVVEDGVGEDRLGERVDPGGAVAAQHVRAARPRRRRRRSASCRARPPAGRPASSTPLPFSTSSKIAAATTSRGPSESVNSSPSAFRSTAP